MSLNWDVSKVADYKSVCYRPDPEDSERVLLNPITDALIWATMFVGLHEISEKNVDEWDWRYRAMDVLGEYTLSRPGPDGREHFNPSREDVQAHIGLHTNAWPSKTRAQWLRGWFRNTLDAAVSERQRKAGKEVSNVGT